MRFRMLYKSEVRNGRDRCSRPRHWLHSAWELRRSAQGWEVRTESVERLHVVEPVTGPSASQLAPVSSAAIAGGMRLFPRLEAARSLGRSGERRPAQIFPRQFP